MIEYTPAVRQLVSSGCILYDALLIHSLPALDAIILATIHSKHGYYCVITGLTRIHDHRLEGLICELNQPRLGLLHLFEPLRAAT